MAKIDYVYFVRNEAVSTVVDCVLHRECLPCADVSQTFRQYGQPVDVYVEFHEMFLWMSGSLLIITDFSKASTDSVTVERR